MPVTPDRYYKDPVGYARNQTLHALLGWFSFHVVFWLALLGPVNPIFYAVGVAAIYFVVIEIPQIVGSNKSWVVGDSLSDTMYVWFGAAYAATESIIILAFVTAALAAGCYYRYKRARSGE